MFKSDLNHAETIQHSLAARTIEHEQRSIAYPCYGNSETDTLLIGADKALQVAQDFESYIDMQIDGIDFDNYIND